MMAPSKPEEWEIDEIRGTVRIPESPGVYAAAYCGDAPTARFVLKAARNHKSLVNSLATVIAEFEGAAIRAGWSRADIDHQMKQHRVVLAQAKEPNP